MLFRSPRGTKDILPEESFLWQEVEAAARAAFALSGFQEIRTPVLEESKLFSRSLGDLTDIVQKQMFLIKKETDTFVLRPEATAAIVRAYLENTLYSLSTVSKFYYIGPMFRAERPQRGRLRQFHHIGAEAIGSYHPYLDAEIVSLATGLLGKFGLSGFTTRLNTLGCLHDKKKFGLSLKERLTPLKKSFCEDCQSRLGHNIFRLLDCKNSQCRQIILSLNLGRGHLCGECVAHFEGVQEGLALLGVVTQVDPFLVRGLDYYTRTVFEITHAALGAQDALGAGGRYDNLVEELGGPARGACGFALGVERVFLARGSAPAAPVPAAQCYVVPLGAAALKKALETAEGVRAAGISCDLDYLEGSLKAKLRRADKTGARWCFIIGDNELAKGAGILKDMKAGSQQEVAFDRLAPTIKGQGA